MIITPNKVCRRGDTQYAITFRKAKNCRPKVCTYSVTLTDLFAVRTQPLPPIHTGVCGKGAADAVNNRKGNA